MPQRIVFGLDRLPRTLRPDDPRLPAVIAGGGPLRLNSEPLPADALGVAADDHAARVATMKQYLHGLCGAYAPLRLRFVDCYVDAMAAHVEAHRGALASGLQRYHGLYAPEDWLWSALRPLPRAWLASDSGPALVDFAFWDGMQAIAIGLDGAAARAGIVTHQLGSGVLAAGPLALLQALPDSFRNFWRGQVLPASPFRRPVPLGAVTDGAARA